MKNWVVCLAVAIIWAVVIWAISFVAPDYSGKILIFVGGGVAVQLLLFGSVAARNTCGRGRGKCE